MKKIVVLCAVFVFTAVLLFSCGDKPADTGNGPAPVDTTKKDTTVDTTPKPMDLTVIGKWEGALPKIPLMNFNGARIFLHIADVDSAFTLVTRDPAGDTTLPIKDTTLILMGKWRLTPPGDSILLICDTGRIIDTTTKTLVPRPVKGKIISIPVVISKNETSGAIQWEVGMDNLIPLAPLMGIDLTGVPVDMLKIVRIIMIKRSQTGPGFTGFENRLPGY